MSIKKYMTDKKEPIRILHWINLTRLFRCHLTFDNTDEFTHYYITDRKRHNLNDKPNVYTGNPRDGGFLKKILGKVKPDVIVCSNLINPNLMSLMKKNCGLFVYISHTIWTDGTIKQKLDNRKHDNAVKAYSVFDRMYFLKKEIDMWRNLGMPENKLVTVCGLTYMDPLLTIDYEKKRNRMLKKLVPNRKPSKTMLLIHNSTLTGCIFPNGGPKNQKVNSDDYGIMLNEMVKYAKEHDCHIFAKIGRRSSTLTETPLIKKLHASPYVTVVRPEQDYLLADFLFCDAIINQSYSAAYQESLIANHCAACCYINGKEIVDSDKYPNLLVIRGANEIQLALDKMINHRDDFYTPELNKEIDSLIIDTFGAKFENVTERILEDIRNWKSD